MKLTLTIKSCCTVCLTIPILGTVKTLILRCSCWSNVPNMTYKTQLASISSISCNILHVAHHQSLHKRQWSMLRNRSFDSSSRQIRQLEKAFNTITSSSESRQEGLGSRKSSSLWGIGQLAIQKEARGGEMMTNALLNHRRETAMDQELCG